MRRIAGALALTLTVVLAACGGDSAEGPNETPDPTLPSDVATIAVRTLAEVELDPSGSMLVCPGGFAPCWEALGTPPAGLSPGWATVEGDWAFGMLSITDVEPAGSEPTAFPDPCAADEVPLTDGDPVDRTDGGDAALDGFLDSIPDRLAAVWQAEDDGPLVVSVTDEADELRAELSSRGVGGVCIADLGAEYPLAELESVQEDTADRFTDWGDAGWVALSSSIDTTENRVVISFDEVDQRLRTEIEETWGDLVRIDAFVEVLDGTVADLATPTFPDDIPITTQPRQRGGMAALGQFTLRYDPDLDCVYLEGGDTDRVKPIWPFGSRALRDPAVVVDGRGVALAAVDQEIEVGGGYGQILPDATDPSDCGADSVWVIAPE